MKNDRRSPAEERVLVLAPTLADAALSRTILTGAGLECQVFSDVNELCRALEKGAGALLLIEEALARSEPVCLLELIEKQPAWSDLPILLLAERGADSQAWDSKPLESPARRILVVDDNVDSAESLGTWLKLMGHDVELVHEGLAAVEVARAYQLEVIALDIGLPDIDGYEVAERLRQAPGFDQVLLIALTGYGQEEDRQRCYDSGFDEHLLKPVDPASLKTLLSSR